MPGKKRPGLVKRIMRGTLMAQLWIFGPALAIVIGGFAITGKFIQPAPPDSLTIATGGPDGAYFSYAQRYKEVLAREGVTLEIRQTQGSVENLALIEDGTVDVAFLQSGIAVGNPNPNVIALGSLYFEPLWVFHRTDTPIDLLRDLVGKRIAVGGVGSGTRAVAAPLLARNGVTETTARIIDTGGMAAATQLRDGTIDAAFYIAAAESPVIRALLADERIDLLSFRRAEAYTRHYLYMSKVVLPQGMVDFQRDLPAADKTLLAPAATLVVHDDLHPALRTLLLRAMTEIHSPGGLFERPGQFPSAQYVDFPLSDKAERYLNDGPSLLDRYLPYWVADMIIRLSILLLPLLTLLIPLMRVLPPIYRWRMRSRIVRWYKEMVRIEAQVRAAKTPEERATAMARLDEIDEDVSHVNVPVGFRDMHYTLRFHIDLLRGMLHRKDGKAGPDMAATTETRPAAG